MNPLKKQAQMAVLQGMLNRPTADAVTPIGPLGDLATKEKSQMPSFSGKGLKESLTKKLKPRIP